MFGEVKMKIANELVTLVCFTLLLLMTLLLLLFDIVCFSYWHIVEQDRAEPYCEKCFSVCEFGRQMWRIPCRYDI